MIDEKLWDKRRKIEDTIDALTEGIEDAEEIKHTRQWLFRGLIETFGTWQETGDCLPELVVLSPREAIVKIEVVKGEDEVMKILGGENEKKTN